MTRNTDIIFTTEYIKNVLYFATVRPGKTLNSTSGVHYFCIDNDLVYENYYSDFGPLNLGCVYKYCKILSEKLKQYLNKQTIVHFTSNDPKKKANAAFLLGCYGVLYLSLTPRDALKPLMSHGHTYRAFQDATQGDSIYSISLLDCLNAIRKARQLGFFNFQDFNYEEYERLDKIQGGDLNWIVPGKFLAFIGPVDYSVSLFHPPEMYIEYFKENNVNIVIRLNKRMYDGDVFNNAGITHYDLFFPDGSCPPRHILMKFLQIAEEADGALAVHCKAGLGRTGSLIGSYLIKHYRMTAHEAIGWMRICRPGSVIGHQQAWLEHLEAWLTKQGNLYRKRMFQDVDKLPVHEFGVYSMSEKLMKRLPVVFNKPPSPPSAPAPLMQRQTRSDTTPPRPQASKTREAKLEDDEKFIASTDLTTTSALVPMKVKGCVLKNYSLPIEQAESSPREPPRNFWQKFFSCDDCLWKLAVRCARKTPRRCDANACCRCFDRVAPCKPIGTQQYDWRLKYKSNVMTKMINKGCQPSREPSEISRRSSGAGEPRVLTRDSQKTSLRTNLGRVTTHTATKVASNVRDIGTPIPTFRTSQGSVIKTLSDAKNFLIKSSLYDQQREKSLNSSVTVTPYSPAGFHVSTGNATNISSYLGPRAFQRRRLPLGRSPSPSPNPSPTRYMDQTRATNTMPADKFLAKERTSIREALSNLKLSGPRCGGSIGAASVGVASLGACRDAPAGKRAPSVRSDERPLATQGDMLNSIKFQRRFRDTLTNPLNSVTTRPPAITNYGHSSKTALSKDKTSNRFNTRNDNTSKPSTWKPPNSSSQRVYPANSRAFSPHTSPQRPTSPKGRTRATSFF